jgi:hypothetical protein
MAAENTYWSASPDESPSYDSPGVWANTSNELARYIEQAPPIQYLRLANMLETELDQYLHILNRLHTLRRFVLSESESTTVASRLTLAALEGNAGLERLEVHGAGLDRETAERFCTVLETHGLRKLEISMPIDSMRTLFADVVRSNRSLRIVRLTIAHEELLRRWELRRMGGNFVDGAQELADFLKTQMKSNWSIRSFYMAISRISWGDVIIDEPSMAFKSDIYCNYALALRTTPLNVYETLWVLDWVPAFRKRYVWRGDEDFDPYRGKKIAILERVRMVHPIIERIKR